MRKRTHEEYVEIVRVQGNSEYEVLGRYVDSHTKIKMKHKICGYEWEQAPTGFISKKSRCMRCGYVNMKKKQRKTNSYFSQEVSELVGDEYLFLDKYVNNTTKLSVRHEKCGHVYTVIPRDFLSGRRCPDCKGKRISEGVKRCPEDFANEFEVLSKGEYQLIGTYSKAIDKIEMKHVTCGHVFLMAPIKFTGGNRCPKCKSSKGERHIVDFLTEENIPFETQWRSDECKRVRPLPFDVAILGSSNVPKILIEYEGEQHYRVVPFFGGEEGFIKRKENDATKEEFCKRKGIPLISIPYYEDITKYEAIILDLYANLEPSAREIA